MSRKINFVVVFFLLVLTSCGGWSEDQKTKLNNTCLGSGEYDCDCYTKKILDEYPNPDDFNKLSQDQKDELVKDCKKAVEEEVVEEDIEAF